MMEGATIAVEVREVRITQRANAGTCEVCAQHASPLFSLVIVASFALRSPIESQEMNLCARCADRAEQRAHEHLVPLVIRQRETDGFGEA